MKSIFAICLISLALVGSISAQSVIFVDVGGIPPGAGTATDPFVSIQDGITAAISGDTVSVAPGTYVEAVDFLGKAITVQSSGGSGLTTIDGEHLFPHLVSFVTGETADAVLDGFTIEDGGMGIPIPQTIGGGGILCQQSSPTIRNCRITSCGIHVFNPPNLEGAGLAAFDGAPTITDCVVDDNFTTVGSAAGMAFTNCNVTITNCAILENQSVGSGGLSLSNCTAQISHCMFWNNGGDAGGGVSCSGAISFESCDFMNNSGLNGSAVYHLGGSVAMTNCLVRFNGSGIAVDGIMGGVSCRGCLFYGNVGAINGGTLDNCTVANNDFVGGTGTITNSIIWGNLSSGLFGTPTVEFSDIEGGDGMGNPYPGQGNILADPRFRDSAMGDYRLIPDSPGIDAGSNALVRITTDLDGQPRISDGAVDMGSDESFRTFPGSSEDFGLEGTVNTLGTVDSIAPTALGDLVELRMRSPQGTFDFFPVLLVAQVFPTGTPPTAPAPFTGVLHVDVNDDPAPVLILGQGGLLAPTILTPQGPSIAFYYPFSLFGTSVMLQALAVTYGPPAQNDFFAISDGLELRGL